MRLTGIVGVIIIMILIVVSIVVGNFFFGTILGVDLAKLPAGLKFFVHACGAGAVAYIVYKLFRH